MSEPVCFPVCQRCANGCILASGKNLKSTRPSKQIKKKNPYKWSPDVVRLVCGTEVVMPMVHLSYKGKYYCDKHGKYEKPIPKPRKRKVYPEKPLF